MNISFNPQLTTSPQNTFLRETEGYVQGATFDDPSMRMHLAAGVIDVSVEQPVWGGIPIVESVPVSNKLGGNLKLAATQAAITGFTVFDQAHNMIIVPGNSVQMALAGMTAHFYRLNSNMRIAVQCDAALADELQGNPINQQVSWDFEAQALTTYSAGTGALPVKVLSLNTSSKIVNYNAGTGALEWAIGAAVMIQI